MPTHIARLRPSLAPGALFLGAFVLRMVCVLQARSSPLFDRPVVDARTYVETARALAQGQWLGPADPFWQPPLYPYLLGLVFSVFGDGLLLPRLLQAGLGAASCVLLLHLGRQAFGATPAWIAAGAAVLYGPFLYFDGELLPVGLALFLDLCLLLALLWAARGEGVARWAVAGAVLGLAALAVANVLVFLPVALIFAWILSRRQGSEQPWRASLSLVLGVAVVLAPVTLRNRVVGGEWVLLSYNSGVNFYIGNNPDYDRTVAVRPGRAWRELVNLPESEAGTTGRAAGSAWFFARSWDYIRGDPVDYAALLLRKSYLFLQGDEIPRNLDPYLSRQSSPILSLLLWKRGLAFPFGVISPLALLAVAVFLATWRRQTDAGWLVLLFAVTYAASMVAFFVTARYRLPAVPCLLLLAAWGVCRLTAMRGWTLAFGLTGVVVLGLAANAGMQPSTPGGDAQHRYWEGVAYHELGMRANALREYSHALDLNPVHEEALFGLALVLTERGDFAAALKACRRLLSQYPDRYDVRLLRADLLLVLEDYEEAASAYAELIASDPERAALHAGHAYASLRAGQPERAVGSYEMALQLEPESAEIRYRLAHLYERLGRLDSAAAHYERLLERPLYRAESLSRLGWMALDRGDTTAARTRMRRAVEVDSSLVSALIGLARLEADHGRHLDAAAWLERAAAHETLDPGIYRMLAALYQRAEDTERARQALESYRHAERLQRRNLAEEETRHLRQWLRRQLPPP